jgi:uncharacterized protein
VAAEACYLVVKYVGAVAEINLVETLAPGDLNRDRNLIRRAELMRQYIGFLLCVADASVIAAAERLRASEVAPLDKTPGPGYQTYA